MPFLCDDYEVLIDLVTDPMNYSYIFSGKLINNILFMASVCVVISKIMHINICITHLLSYTIIFVECKEISHHNFKFKVVCVSMCIC